MQRNAGQQPAILCKSSLEAGANQKSPNLRGLTLELKKSAESLNTGEVLIGTDQKKQ